MFAQATTTGLIDSLTLLQGGIIGGIVAFILMMIFTYYRKQIDNQNELILLRKQFESYKTISIKQDKLTENVLKVGQELGEITLKLVEEPILQYVCDHDQLPVRSTEFSSGIDVLYPNDESLTIEPGKDALINLGLKFDIPYGWDLVVHNKSGVSTKMKCIVGACVIDSDYIGFSHAHLFNLSDKPVTFTKGQKICQLLMRRIWLGQLKRIESVEKVTERGAGGFGSTGSHVKAEQQIA